MLLLLRKAKRQQSLPSMLLASHVGHFTANCEVCIVSKGRLTHNVPDHANLCNVGNSLKRLDVDDCKKNQKAAKQVQLLHGNTLLKPA